MLRRKPDKWIMAAVIFSWAAAFIKTDSYFAVYFLIALLDIAACFADRRQYGERSGGRLPPWQNALVAAASVLFSLAVSASNYQLFVQNGSERTAYSLIMLVYYVAVTLFGVCAAWEGLHYLALKAADIRFGSCRRVSPRRTFWLCFGASLLVNSAVLILCYYPGLTSVDSINQIGQALSGQYSNHHPYYHTLFLRLMLNIGMTLFGNINVGVFLYSLAQIIIMALCFGYAAATVAEMGMPKWAVLATAAYFVLMPFNIWFSFTVWKDILFSGFTLVFVTSVFRRLNRLGSHSTADAILAAASCLGVCILRGNGWFAMSPTVVIFALLFFKREKALAFSLAAVLALSFVMNHQVLDALGVRPTESVELLSIPIQQVARAVVDNDDLAPDETELIEKVIGIEYIREKYRPGLADPMKFYIADNNLTYFDEHTDEYKALYLRVLREYPGSCIKAWIDQTKGYWNGGYEYWRWCQAIESLGIEQNCRSELIKTLFLWYSWAFSAFPLLQPLLSIGLFTWLVCTAAVLALIRKNREAFFIALPVLAIIGTLFIATPVYAEFRYAYPMFCAAPLLLTAVFYKKRV